MTSTKPNKAAYFWDAEGRLCHSDSGNPVSPHRRLTHTQRAVGQLGVCRRLRSARRSLCRWWGTAA